MTDGRLALTFDDGFREDYEELWPVLRERGAAASLAITPRLLGESGYLARDQLAELVEAGWEVMAHGRRHRYLGVHALAADAAAGDERLALDGDGVFPDGDHAVYPGDEYEVTDGAGTETVVLASKGRDGRDRPTVALESPLSGAYAGDEAVLRPTAAQLRDEIVGLAADLGELGPAPTSFAFPYDAADPRAWRLAADAYDAVVNAAVRSLPNPPGAPSGSLRRYYLETDRMRPGEIGTYLDAVAETGGLGILAGHSGWETVTPERVAAVVDAARERGVEVVTVREALGG